MTSSTLNFKETTLKVEMKHLVLVLPYLDSISLQTNTKLKKSLKHIDNYCKIQLGGISRDFDLTEQALVGEHGKV